MRRKRMTEDALVTVLAERANVNNATTRRVVNALRGHIRDGVNASAEQKLYVPGFGTFSRGVHRGHPLNLGIEGVGDRIGDYEVVRFKADEAFKSLVLGPGEEKEDQKEAGE